MAKKTVTVEMSDFQQELLDKAGNIGSIVYACHPTRGIIEDVITGLAVNGEKISFVFRGILMESINKSLIALSKEELDAKIDAIKEEEIEEIRDKYEKLKSGK